MTVDGGELSARSFNDTGLADRSRGAVSGCLLGRQRRYRLALGNVTRTVNWTIPFWTTSILAHQAGRLARGRREHEQERAVDLTPQMWTCTCIK